MNHSTCVPPYVTGAPARGMFRRFKSGFSVLLLFLFFAIPHLRYDRGPDAPDQALLLDVAGRRAYFFGLELLPDELFFIAAGLIGGALLLFAVTAAFGRVWCGFSCPQTVWTDLFVGVERWIMKGGKATSKARVALKHGAWVAMALITSYGWIAYFSDARALPGLIVSGKASLALLSMFGVFAGATYVLAGYARGKVCTHMCPWPRFQSAMFDDTTAHVFYDKKRGEPRGKGGKARREGSALPLGDCVDCGRCVTVCPMEIDIRDGFQLSCIGCGLCADACDTVMEKTGSPKGLVRYGKPVSAGKSFRHWYPYVYTAMACATFSALVMFILMRSPVGLGVQHINEPLYVRLSNGSYRNAYRVHLVNRTGQERVVTIGAEGDIHPKTSLNGSGNGTQEAVEMHIPPRASITSVLYLHTSGSQAKNRNAAGRLGAREVTIWAKTPERKPFFRSNEVFWTGK